MPRSVVIHNAHPRLRIPRAAVVRSIRLLDEHFEMLPADLPRLSLPRARLAALKSKLKNQKSKIRAVAPDGELSLVFLTDPALAQIHADFMNDPTATDVITFEGDPAAGLAGEVCVSADTAATYVALSLADRPSPRRRPAPQSPAQPSAFAAELTLYLVHGWLHLSGYDDLQPAKKRRMRAAEARAMKLLRSHDAIPAFRLAPARR